MAGCIVVAGGQNCQSAEVYDEALGRWVRLPRTLPHISHLEMRGVLL